jgi:hypothetical protein
MHRAFAVIAVVLAFGATSSFAQTADGWTANGTNTTTTNSVAIGTNAAPGAKLEVVGDALVGYRNYFRGRNSVNGLVPLAGVDFGTFGVTAGVSNVEVFGVASVNGFQFGSGYAGISGGWPGLNGQMTFHTNNAERIRIDPAGNIGIGTQTPTFKLDVRGTAHFSGDVTVDGNIGAKFQDVAEWVPAAKPMTAGTVVVLDREQTNHVTPSLHPYDTAVAGVVSDQPGIILGKGDASKAKIATTGRVKVRVDATRQPIAIGDLLVTSDEEGVAMKSQPIDFGGVTIHRPGTVIGKALEPLAAGKGEILVLLTLQ